MSQFTRKISQLKFQSGSLIMVLAAIILSSNGLLEVHGCNIHAPKLHFLDKEPCCYHVSGLDYCPDGNKLIRGSPYCGRRPCVMDGCQCHAPCQPGGWRFTLFKDAHFSGQQVVIVKDQETKCVNLEERHRNWVTSLKTNELCVRIFSELDCKGEYTDLTQYNMGTCSNHKNLTECGWDNRILSVSKCEYTVIRKSEYSGRSVGDE